MSRLTRSNPGARAAALAGLALTGAAALLAWSPAQAQVYRCESDAGVPVYQGTPSGRNCRAVDLTPLTTIPAPKLPAQKPGAAAGKGDIPTPTDEEATLARALGRRIATLAGKLA